MAYFIRENRLNAAVCFGPQP